MAEFILLQMFRTLETRETFKQLTESLSNHLRELGASEKMVKKYSLGTSEEDMKRFQIFMLLSDGFDNLIKSFCDRWWVFWDNRTKYGFYTSDHPAIGISYPDLGTLAYEVFLPLTPKYAMSILLKEGFPQFDSWDETIQVLDDKRNVTFYNSQIVTGCNRQVYCADGNFSLAKKLKNQKPGLGSDGKPRIDIN